MAAVSVSFVMKVSAMVILMITVYFTMTSEVDLAQKQKSYNYMREIALYVESKMAYGLDSVTAYGSNSTQRLSLPYLDFPYVVSMSCDDSLSIVVSSEGAGRYYEVVELMNCSKITASGEVFEGERCITVSKTNETTTSVELEDSCGNI